MPAKASSLYFEKVAVKTTSERTCLSFARQVIHPGGYTGIHTSQSEAAGNTQGVYVSITCVGRGSLPAIAVVMAMSDDFAAAKQVGHTAATHMAGVQLID
ncbi:hypothetical protein RHOFW104T7_13855 [Rhodanobacter thiooxydans]|uniref:Uncharacterized protein n=2 Tax=Rhodanobacter thiooxydans TaxID=416169 RepID=A0A154QGI2_9GAMM|nr:hypothetical protein RHOFW104T7_13855 [Rhodanobacter thiooxydans]